MKPLTDFDTKFGFQEDVLVSTDQVSISPTFYDQFYLFENVLVSISPNVLLAAFMLVDPKSVKKIDSLTVFFMLLGSTSMKAVSRTLMKLSPGSVFST